MTLQEEIAAMLEAEERRLGVESEELRQRHNELMERIDRLVEAHRSRKEKAMGYREIKEWLDRLVENRKERAALTQLNSSICTVGAESTIHLYKGIEIIADVLGVPLQKTTCCGTIMYYCVYNGTEIRQIGKSNEK